MNVLVSGDIHGNLTQVAYLREVLQTEPVDAVVAVGDTGYLWHREFIAALQELATLFGIAVFWCDGNHDDHTMIARLMAALGADWTAPVQLWPDAAPDVWYVPRGCVVDFEGVRAMFVGGAISVDRTARRDFIEHWPEEALTYAQVYTASGNGPVDVLFSHDVPADTEPIERRLHVVGATTIDRAARSNRLALRSIVESVRPRLLVHGHYHYRYNGVHRCDDGYTTEVVGLGRDGQGEDSWVVVDLDLWK